MRGAGNRASRSAFLARSEMDKEGCRGSKTVLRTRNGRPSGWLVSYPKSRLVLNEVFFAVFSTTSYSPFFPRGFVVSSFRSNVERLRNRNFNFQKRFGSSSGALYPRDQFRLFIISRLAVLVLYRSFAPFFPFSSPSSPRHTRIHARARTPRRPGSFNSVFLDFFLSSVTVFRASL